MIALKSCQLRRCFHLSPLLGLALTAAGIARAAEFPVPGERPKPPGVHALTGGTVVVRPGTVLSNATVLIAGGRITGAGANLVVPPGARVWDLKGATVYAGFIESCWAADSTNKAVDTGAFEPIAARDDLRAGVAPFLGAVGENTDRGGRGAGADRPALAPERNVHQTYSPRRDAIEALRENGFTAAHAVPDTGILRGSTALVQLAVADPNNVLLRPAVFQHVAFDSQASAEDVYPQSLMGVIAAVRQTLLDAQHARASKAAAAEIPFNPALDALAPVVAGEMPLLFEPGSVLMNDRAARIATEFGVKFAVIASGFEWRRPDLPSGIPATFVVPLNLPALPKLPHEDDWDQISLDRLRAWDWAAENPALLRNAGRVITLTTYGLGDRKAFRKNLRSALDRGLSEVDALAALTTAPAELCGIADRLGTIEAGKLANLTIVDGSYFDPSAKIREVWVGGERHPVADPEWAKQPAPKTDGKDDSKTGDAKKKSKAAEKAPQARVARSPLEDRGPLPAPATVLVRGATLWTCGPEGILTNADLLVRDGKILSAGRNLSKPDGDVLVIEARGRHVTPGLIDAHSHTAILGGVNEGTLPSTAMVRVGDVINSETETLRQQLAGGLTVANLLHGSANPIGGQNAVIKLRDGAQPEALKFAGAPGGIKFALGENVKQSNWGDKYTRRFPQSRMGVRTFFANRFEAARQYAAEWKRHRADGGPPPRRDLELEALAEILAGERLIHCHSYRQDEILMFLRVCEEFGVKIGTLQHVLEGYKVADEIAKHGAGASCFSDWWAYKFEVVDASAYAGSLMHSRGVNVSFNSDSSELARRMYLEAAKAVKYGGTPEAEALKFVTLNPAQQLGIGSHVGSLEPGKDADFVLWSRSPLDSLTVCEQTWIDGKKYFDRDEEAKRVERLAAERTALIAKAKKAQAGDGEKGAGDAARAEFFRVALERAADLGHLECRDCLDVRKDQP